MKKYLVVLLALMMVLCMFSVAQAQESSTIIDWAGATDADLNGGAMVSGFSDLSYWDTPSSGTQSINNGMFQIEILENDYSCFQFSLSSAFNDENKSQWAQYDQLRFYMENNTDGDINMTMYLFIDDAAVGYGASHPMTNGLGVYLLWADDADEIYEPDYRYDDSFANRYYYIPQGFKGWVVIPSTFASEFGDDYVGWIPSYWADPAAIDYSIASMEKAGGLSVDIRADGVGEGTLCFGSFVLENEDAQVEPTQPAVDTTEPAVDVTEPAVDVTEPVVDVTEPAVDVTEPAVDVTEPAVDVTEPVVDVTEPVVDVTEEASAPANDATEVPGEQATQGAQGEGGDNTVIIIVIAAVVVIAGAVAGVVFAKKAKKKAE